MHRFIIPNFDTIKNLLHIHEADFVNQVKQVLKMRAGEEIIISNGQGQEALFKISGFDKRGVSLQLVETLKNENESGIHTMIYCAMLKKENFELVCQKTTEIGIKEICPMITSRTIKTGFDRKRLEKIIKEAAEQSGRAVLPILHEPKTFLETIQESAANNDVTLLFDKEGKKFEQNDETIKKIGFCIGPEGGFTKEEKTLAQTNHVQIVGLGQLTLRAETAALIASYLVIM